MTTFIDQLSQLLQDIPKHHVIIVGGDMNAQISSDDCRGNSFNNTTNRNGRYFLDMTSECNMFLLSTSYNKRKGKLWT